jgi:hypothetical protein
MTQKLEAKEGILSMTVQVKRKDTGKVEEYVLTGKATPEQFEAVKASVPVIDKEKE